MNKKLEILVTHYKEPWEVCHFLFDSLALQVGVNFDDIRVIILNDGEEGYEHIKTALYQNYPYEVIGSAKDWEGISTCRNALLDMATAPYIMWCDCDDMFYSATGLWQIIREIDKEPFNILSSDFLEEVSNGKETKYITHKDDPIFVHGKVYNREFLLNKKIRFNDGINRNEDSPFNMLVLTFTATDGTHRNITQPFYLWKTRVDSTVRGCKNYNLDSTQDLLHGSIMSIRRLLDDGYEADSALLVHHMLLQTYIEVTHEYWYDKDQEQNLHDIEYLIGSMLIEFNDIIPRVDRQALQEKMDDMIAKENEVGRDVNFYEIKGWLDYCLDTYLKERKDDTK